MVDCKRSLDTAKVNWTAPSLQIQLMRRVRLGSYGCSGVVVVQNFLIRLQFLNWIRGLSSCLACFSSAQVVLAPPLFCEILNRLKKVEVSSCAISLYPYNKSLRADVAQLVEHNLAKVGVAGSNPVVRSRFSKSRLYGFFSFSLPFRF